MSSPKDKLIVALDVDNAQRARELVSSLRDTVGMFKVGSQLFTAEGPLIVREIVDAGSKVFLDLKFHDIPNTVLSAGIEATRLGVSIFNVHALGGREMMQRTADAVSEVAIKEGIQRPLVIAVTILTSADNEQLSEIGISSNPADQVIRLALLAESAGMDGVVASPHEIAGIRDAVNRSDFKVITPGVRPAEAALQDQKRVMTPSHAISAGADYLVVGRPITNSPDPINAARQILAEMEAAFPSAK
ncbi:MAG TPA: orotidine-5'-phosphate decarboxylase [Pyrinomonadaceae bacterium]|nr:orotidine-5'-phosphate decarboxylase [Pyrinomonadaceae bacterium]